MSSLWPFRSSAPRDTPAAAIPPPSPSPWRSLSASALLVELQRRQRRTAQLHDEIRRLDDEQRQIAEEMQERCHTVGGSRPSSQFAAPAVQPAPPPPRHPSLKVVVVRGASALSAAADLQLWRGLLRGAKVSAPLWMHVVQVDANDAAALQREIGSVDAAQMRSWAGAVRPDVQMRTPTGVLVVWCVTRAGGRIQWIELLNRLERLPRRAAVTPAESVSGGPAAAPSSLPVSLSLCVADRIRDHEPHYSAAPPPAGPSADAHRGVQSLCGGRLLSLLVSQSQVEQSRQADGGAALSDVMLLAGSGSRADQRSGAGHDPDAQRSQEMLQAGLDATAVRANQTTTAAVDAWLVQQLQGSTHA